MYRADSRFAPSQWETSLQSNTVSHWLGANLESSLHVLYFTLAWSWWLSTFYLFIYSFIYLLFIYLFFVNNNKKTVLHPSLILMALYNLSINQKGLQHICSRPDTLAVLAWILQGESVPPCCRPHQPPARCQRTQDAMITSLLRQNDVATFWRDNDVIITSCARWDTSSWAMYNNNTLRPRQNGRHFSGFPEL